jgi:hypothetical protein
MELIQNTHAPAADNGYHCIDLFFLEPFQQMIGHVHFLNQVVLVDLADIKWIDPGRLTQNSPAGRLQILDPLAVEKHQSAIGVVPGIQQSVESIADADELPSQVTRCEGCSGHDVIHPGYKAATHVNGDASCFFVHVIVLYEDSYDLLC